METLADVETALFALSYLHPHLTGLKSAQNVVAKARRAILALHEEPKNALEHSLVNICGKQEPTAPYLQNETV